MFPLGVSAFTGLSISVFLDGAFELMLNNANIQNKTAWPILLALACGCFFFVLLARDVLIKRIRRVRISL